MRVQHSTETIEQIKHLLNEGISGYKVSKQLNLAVSTVYDIIKRLELKNG